MTIEQQLKVLAELHDSEKIGIRFAAYNEAKRAPVELYVWEANTPARSAYKCGEGATLATALANAFALLADAAQTDVTTLEGELLVADKRRARLLSLQNPTDETSAPEPTK